MADARPDEPREASGLTTHLVLDYVEREGGREAVEALLARCDMTGRESELRDENRWFADRTRVCLFEGAAEVLGDPDVGRRIGETALDFNVGQAVRLSLRALGSPRLIYSNVGRANAKFNRVHQMDVLKVGKGHARIRNVPIGEAQWAQCDCDYNIGLLSCGPPVFGQPPARVRHPRCIGAGDAECIYEVEWSSTERPATAVTLSVGALVTLVASVLLSPDLLPAAIGAAVAVILLVGTAALVDRRRRWNQLTAQVDEQAAAAGLLMESMQDLVSALKLEEVLSKITANARSTVGGAEFALLAKGPEGLRCRSSSGLPAHAIASLERWADSSADIVRHPASVDDLATVTDLEALPLDEVMPLGSLCAAPLIYRGDSLGVLVALAVSRDGFLPRDVDLLSSYAAQAAIAVTNATLYEAQQELATQDPLTGLFNHRHFHETLGQELDRCRRHGGDVGLVLFDLNGFKQVNDTGGHAEGDEVLRRVARALRNTCRRSDLPFRIGGDEFAVVLPSTADVALESAANRACEAISAIDNRTSVSYGIASWPAAGPTKDSLLAAADTSLYAMKHRTRGDSTAATATENGAGKHERLASASRIAVKLAPLLTEAAVAETAIKELQASFGYHRVAVHALESEGILRPIASAGDEASLQPGTGAPGSAARAARTGEAVLLNDPRPGSARSSELVTPIRVEGEPWGVLELVHRGVSDFDFDDVLFADTIAAAIGAAIHRIQLYAELENTFMRTLAVLSDALEAKDSYTAAHAREVADLADRVGRSLGMEADELRTLSYGALLHDIGKIAIRSEILHKPAKLTDAEYEEMKEHTVIGARMLERIPYFAEVHPLVHFSHERWDGGGYPDGMAGEAIPLGARIIAACDAFHAMTSNRPYRSAMDDDSAVEELLRHSGTQFDPAVVESLLALLAEPEPGPAPNGRVAAKGQPIPH